MTLVILLTSVRPYQGLSKANISKINNFEPPWWSYEKFYASVIFQAVRRSFPRLWAIFLFFFLHPVLAYIPCVLRFDNRVATISLDLDDEFENEEDVAKIWSVGSSGFLSSVMRYLLTDSKIPRWNLSSVTRPSERFAARLHNSVIEINEYIGML